MLASDPDPLTAHDIGAEASWADKFRDSPDPAVRARYDATWRWHFVNLELDRPDLAAACYGPARLPAGAPASQGPAQDCVVDKIAEFAAELADPATVPAERLLALKYLLHFVGDVHQPLHAADDHDAGGNKVRILAPGSTIPTLHVYWDVDAVGGQGRDAAALADGLLARILPAERAAWQAGWPGRLGLRVLWARQGGRLWAPAAGRARRRAPSRRELHRRGARRCRPAAQPGGGAPGLAARSLPGCPPGSPPSMASGQADQQAEAEQQEKDEIERDDRRRARARGPARGVAERRDGHVEVARPVPRRTSSKSRR
jgi:hypothetical protein